MRSYYGLLVLAAGIAAAGCDDHDHGPMMGMTGPTGSGAPGYGLSMSVTPTGGATGVPTSTSITIRFGGAMSGPLERYVDLHVGGLDGPIVDMRCAWSGDRATLTCTPLLPLQPGTTYLVHVGASGMMGWGWHEPHGSFGMAYPFTTAV